MGKKKAIKTLETTAITFDESEAIAEQDPSPLGSSLMAMTEKELENRQQIRLQLVNLQQERQTKELGNLRLMQVLGFVMAIIALITGSLIGIFNRDIQGAIAGGSLGITGIFSFLFIQIRLLNLIQRDTLENPKSDH